MTKKATPRKPSLLRTHVYVWVGIILIQVSNMTLRVYFPLAHGGLVLLIAFFYVTMFARWERYVNDTLKQSTPDDPAPDGPEKQIDGRQ